MTLIIPNWPTPTTVGAYTTTCLMPSWNYDYYNTPKRVHWLKQVHGNTVHRISSINLHHFEPIVADASITDLPNQALAILTADCVPILIYAPHSREIAAIHAGWRGLHNDIIAKTLAHLSTQTDLMAWIGPHISAQHYEVGSAIHHLFTEKNAHYDRAFHATAKPEHYLFDLKCIAEQQLQTAGIHAVFHNQHCTYEQRELFFSYRRDNTNTGRLATLIWIRQ